MVTGTVAGEAPAHARARDDEDVQQEERARSPFGEDLMTLTQAMSAAAERTDAVLAYVFAAHQREEDDAVEEIGPEDEMATSGANDGCFRVDDDDRQRHQRTPRGRRR